ncbi:DUF805 domain-containing protein [Pectinatus brassicae]|uniref:Uncharacterized membrane protein YhaH (DUF805 family) n=1 Tax=Pectinatus brassicae TaxID=862415 RepID=A0A840UW98_9FIRM|nr:DUF805 domain-containing protein [Pectinatus brassicae]MBB5337163.1 uncharacterized membrane protein YhaH (DUF805 family) [Pectinatus brassicae]
MEEKVKPLNLVDAWHRLKTKLFKFSGRSSRSEYWLGILILYIIGMALEFIYIIACAALAELEMMTLVIIVTVLLVIIALIITVVGFALNVRRLHDMGKSGWWQLISCIPLIGSIVLLYYLVQPSQDDNKYGLQPAETK